MKNSQGVWVGFGIGDSGVTVLKAQHRLLRAYGIASGAVDLGVKETGIVDAATVAAITNFQRTTGLPTTGVLKYATELRMGVVVPVAPTKRFVQQGVGYLAEGFLSPDPAVSYNASRDGGVAEMLRLALPNHGPKVPIGYSQGADVVNRFLLSWPVDRRDEIKCVIMFGDPAKPPGPTLLGNDPGGAGISGVYVPEWARPLTYDFTQPGDMYPNAVGLLPQLYDILTHLDIGVDFMMYLLSMLMSTAGGQLLGTVPVLGSLGSVVGAGSLSGLLGLITPGPVTQTSGPPNLLAMMMNIPAIIQTLMAALQFVITSAHTHYHDTPRPYWRGLTAVDCAAQIVQENVKTATVYTVPGTWAGWNDGPPAWTAWKLP